MQIIRPITTIYNNCSVTKNFKRNGIEKKLRTFDNISPDPIKPKSLFPWRKSNTLEAIPQKPTPVKNRNTLIQIKSKKANHLFSVTKYPNTIEDKLMKRKMEP